MTKRSHTCVMNAKKSAKYFMLLACVFTLGACSHAKEPIVEGDYVIHDPLEESNRRVFAFNQAVDHAVINPILKGYRTIAPKPARTGVRNFLRNLRSPVNFANEVLQADVNGAGKVLLRTVINTTVGVGGLFDVAGYEGIEYEPEDFGQTLAVWGVGHGPYMVVPFIGPSSLRDYTGYFADSMIDPLHWYLFDINHEEIYMAKMGADYLDLRESLVDALTELEASSIDYYASVRSSYYQQRESLIKDNAGQFAPPSIPEYED